MMQHNQTCPVCGKPFWCTGGQWAYKKTCYESGGRFDKLLYYCSWKCLRIAEKEDASKHYDVVTMKYYKRMKAKK